MQTDNAANRQESADSGIRKALVAAQTVIDAKDYPDTAALIEVALAGLDDDYSHAYQDEYQRLWHEAAAERDSLRRMQRLAIEYLLFDQPQVYSTRWYELIHELLPGYFGANVPEALLEELARVRRGDPRWSHAPITSGPLYENIVEGDIELTEPEA